LLRIDHAMGLHRLFWIPSGMDASRGAFVQYRSDELYAILCLESRRHGVTLVGENLGTVPSYVNSAMKRHRVWQMYVVQYELEPSRKAAIGEVPSNCVASLNTHDMPPFAAFWEGDDIEDRRAQGLLDDEPAAAEHEYRARLREGLIEWLRAEGLLNGTDADLQTVMRRLLDYLAASPAEVVIASLEDLWLETRPQNVPGTSTERPNWTRKARHTLEEMQAMAEVVEVLESLARHRAHPEAIEEVAAQDR
jgi:4-alpha-glucanotransferase